MTTILNNNTFLLILIILVILIFFYMIPNDCLQNINTNENFQIQTQTGIQTTTPNENENIIVEFKQDPPKQIEAVIDSNTPDPLATKEIHLIKEFITGNFTIKNLKLHIKKGDILQLIPINKREEKYYIEIIDEIILDNEITQDPINTLDIKNRCSQTNIKPFEKTFKIKCKTEYVKHFEVNNSFDITIIGTVNDTLLYGIISIKDNKSKNSTEIIFDNPKKETKEIKELKPNIIKNLNIQDFNVLSVNDNIKITIVSHDNTVETNYYGTIANINKVVSDPMSREDNITFNLEFNTDNNFLNIKIKDYRLHSESPLIIIQKITNQNLIHKYISNNENYISDVFSRSLKIKDMNEKLERIIGLIQ